jgi:long-chain acyl-CoA synthetase
MSQPQETPLSAFYAWEKQTPEQTFLRQPASDTWRTWTYQRAGDEVRRIAAALLALDLPPKSNIVILSKNCAHWIMADLAIMMAGHVSVPIYPTLPPGALKDLLQHCECKAIFIGKLDNFDNLKEGIDPKMRRISFPIYGPDEGDRWDDLLSRHQPLTEKVTPKPDDVASIMYSSGTTGAPKGAMISFGAFGYVGSQVKQYFRLKTPQKFFSYLPLSHIAERALMEMVALSTGSSISFAQSVQTFLQDLRHEQPSIFGGVPRIYSKFREGILQRISDRRLDQLLSVPGLNILIRRALVKSLGLSRAANIVCGAAPIPVSLLEWFNKIGIEIREMYGMTENTAYSHANFRLIRNGSVGQPWPGVDVKIEADGEILVRHPALMKGYYKDPEATKLAFAEEGFLRTGDQGHIDPQGFLTITGRVKDQFKTEKAKYISPARIELKLGSPDIDQVCVVGTGLPQPIALITLSEAGKAKERNELAAELQQLIEQVNSTLEKHEQLDGAVILPEPWTVDNGLLTPSLKIRRHEIEKRFQSKFKQWITGDNIIVWA